MEFSKPHWNLISGAVHDFAHERDRITSEYRARRAFIVNEYKNPQERLEQLRTMKTDEYRKLTDKAAARVAEGVASLRGTLDMVAFENPSKAFIDRVSMIRNLGITPTKADLERLLKLADGNIYALRATQTLAKTAGYDVEGVPDVEQLSAVLDRLESDFKNAYWSMLEKDLLPDVREYPNGARINVNSTTAAVAGAVIDHLDSSIDGIAEQFDSALEPSVAAIVSAHDKTASKPETPENVKLTEDAAGKIAESIRTAADKANATAARTIGAYK